MAVKTNTNHEIFITGTSSADSITNYGGKVTISTGKGNDYVHTISEPDYNDYENKFFSDESVSIKTGAGNDTVGDYGGWKNTINTGTGNDLISLSSQSYGDAWNTEECVIIYKSGDGNDKIYGFDEDDTLKISGSSYSTTKSGKNIILTVGKGKISLIGAASLFALNIDCSEDDSSASKLITLTEGSDTYSNTVKGATIQGLGGKDSIYNTGKNVSINSGAGNDYIYNGRGTSCTINTGTGNDSVYNRGLECAINTGAGNDSIYNYYAHYCTINTSAGNDSVYNFAGSNCMINTGAGNDLISLHSWSSGNIIIYNSGDDNDKIYGFDENDMLSICGGAYSTVKSGKNVLVTVDDGKITLVGAASLSKLNIEGTKFLKVTNKTFSPVTVDATTKIIDASSRTKAIKITGNGLDNTITGGSKNDSLYGRAGNDSIVGNAGNDKLYGSNGDDTLVGGKGNDTLWGDVGNDKLYGGSGKDVFIYKPGEGTDTIFDYSSGDMLTILKADGTAGGSFNSSKFSGGDLTLTINGGGKVIFENVSASDKFNINGTIYKISGTKLAK